MLALAATQTLQTVESIDIGVLFSIKDKSGPNKEFLRCLCYAWGKDISGYLKKFLPRETAIDPDASQQRPQPSKGSKLSFLYGV